MLLDMIIFPEYFSLKNIFQLFASSSETILVL